MNIINYNFSVQLRNYAILSIAECEKKIKNKIGNNISNLTS